MSKAFLCLFVLLFLYSGAYAQSVDNNTDYGYRGFEGNEETVGSKVDDPPKIRLAAPGTEHGGAGGVVSFNLIPVFGRVAFGGQQIEMCMLRVEQAEDVRGQATNPKGEFNFLCNDGSGTGDRAMKKIFSFTATGVTHMSPEFAASMRSWLGGGGGAAGDRMVSSSGQFVTVQQGDGNFVTYDLARGALGDPNAAVWSSWTGKVEHTDEQSWPRRVVGWMLPGL